ncbi:chromosome partitioning protein ParB [Escherichia coli]|nr:chromosome partitioning protein ParB [Escherichia coli]
MPVTKCEPETTRKASRKSAKTQETVLSALLAQTEEVSVPLASLIKSPLNVRTVPYSAESTYRKLKNQSIPLSTPYAT